MAFTKAVKSQTRLRAAFFGPSGSGKTFTALAVASGMGKKIAVIDSERGSAAKYADQFDFDTVDLQKKTIDEYVANIGEAAKDGYEVLIIDSLSHAWQELLEEMDRLAEAKFRGNSWSAWSVGTPKQRKLVDAILSFPGHIIATMRSKTEWTTSKDERGKDRPTRVGLAPEQGKGIEYEFDLLMEISVDHIANVIKDRTGKFQDELITKPGRNFGTQLIDWLNTGDAAPTPPASPSPKAKTDPPKHPDWVAGGMELAELFKSTFDDKPVFSEEEISVFKSGWRNIAVMKWDQISEAAKTFVEQVRKTLAEKTKTPEPIVQQMAATVEVETLLEAEISEKAPAPDVEGQPSLEIY